MRPYTTADFNRTRANSIAMDRSLNNAFRILAESEKPKKKTVKKDEDDLDEQVLNELFFNKKVDKPAKALSVENSDEENAELFIQWFAYYLNRMDDNVTEALNTFFNDFGKIVAELPKYIIKGVLMLLSKGVKGVVATPKLVAGIVLGAIFALIRLINSGVNSAKEALSNLYKALLNGCQQFYKALCAKTETFVTNSEEKLKTWMGVLTAVFMSVVNKAQGAAETFGNFIKKILEDAHKKVSGAVLIAKTWLQAKSEEVVNWINKEVGNIRSAVVEAWNSMEKKVRNKYNDAVKKLEGWMKSFADLVSLAATKIADKTKEAAQQTKNFVIDKKDKMLAAGIQKAVKGLSDKYTEDQVVALVRKCYNESLIPTFNGSYRIDEKYFYDARTRRRLNESYRRTTVRRRY